MTVADHAPADVPRHEYLPETFMVSGYGNFRELVPATREVPADSATRLDAPVWTVRRILERLAAIEPATRDNHARIYLGGWLIEQDGTGRAAWVIDPATWEIVHLGIGEEGRQGWTPTVVYYPANDHAREVIDAMWRVAQRAHAEGWADNPFHGLPR